MESIQISNIAIGFSIKFLPMNTLNKIGCSSIVPIT